MKQRIQIDGDSLTLRDVWLVAHGDGEVELAPHAREQSRERRHFVDEIVRRGEVVVRRHDGLRQAVRDRRSRSTG